MKFNRRQFIQLGTVTVAGLPFLQRSGHTPFYNEKSSDLDDEALYQLFRQPVNINKPFVRWWWNGIRVVKEELLRELDLLKEAGIGGVEINAIEFPETADALNYQEHEWLSDYWLDMLQIVIEGAKERGLICDVIVGSGWPLGGEFLKEDEQTQMMALGTKNIKGPVRFAVKKEELEKEVDPPVVSSNPTKHKALSFLRLSAAHLDEFTPGIDLNDKIEDEEIVIDIPEGDYVLYYLVKLTGFEKVIHGAPGASGPVLNHYSKKAVEKYLNRMSDAIIKKIGSMGDHLRALFIDSLELEGANWCNDMTDQFKKRRGYDLEPYLPFILFKIKGHAFLADEGYGARLSPQAQELINNVRYDFEVTRMELFYERFFETFSDWCKNNGVATRVQAYGMEFHPIEGSMHLDYPEGESWIKPDVGEVFPDHDFLDGRAYRPINKLVSSGARLAGKKVIGCEEATNTQIVFNATLERLKITGDQSNLVGMTHSIFHGFNYSPPDAPFPGWVRYGTFINEHNPIWPYFKIWFDYKARLSALFQNAELFSDIAVMFPFADTWKGYGTDWYPRPQRSRPSYLHNVWEAIHQNGNSCDCISEHILQKSRFGDGVLTFGRRSYKTLILVEVESIHPETALALNEFAKAGGKIICIEKWPDRSAGFKDYKQNTQKVRETIDHCRQHYPDTISLYPAPRTDEKIIDWYRSIQSKVRINPQVKISEPTKFVSQVCYKTSELDIFFIANYSMHESHSFTAEFDVKGKTAWLWDAASGTRAVYPGVGADNKLNISLGPAESKLFVFDRKPASGEKYIPVRLKTKMIVPGSWEITLNHIDGSRKKIKVNELMDFKGDDRFISFAGAAIYEKDVKVETPEEINYINLGKVYGISEVTLNGKELGLRWYGDHVYPVGNHLKKGVNTIAVKLTTTMGNYMKSLKDNPSAEKWVAKKPFYSQGIIGPVTLGKEERETE